MNRRGLWILAVAAMLLLGGCGGGTEEPGPEVPEGMETEGFTIEGNFAEAMIEGKSGSEMTGMVIFSETDGTVTATVEIEKAPPGTHTAQLYEFGDCSSNDGQSAGGPWNPTEVDHGDLGNIVVGEDGFGSVTLTTDLWSLGTGDDNDIVGLSVIVQADTEDARTGCGVVVKK